MIKALFIKLVRFLGLEEHSRWAYYRLFGRIFPKTVSIRGVPTKCYVQSAHSADSLRILPEEAQVQDWFACRLRHDDVVWDIGANAGQWGIYCARVVGEKGFVYCFEPDRRLASNLRKTLRACGLEWARVCEMAIGATDGEAELFQGIGDPSINSLSFRTDGLQVRKKGVRVPLQTARSLVENGGVELPMAIKIDVEGWEYDVLKGFSSAVWQSCRALVVEVHPLLLGPRNILLDDIRDLLCLNHFVIDEVVSRSTIQIWMCVPGESEFSRVRV